MECRPNFAYGSCNCLLCLYQQQIVFTIWVQLEISQSCNKRRPSLSTCIPSFDVVCYGRIMLYTRTMTLRSEILESWTWKRPTWTYQQQHKLHSSAAGVFSSHHLNFVFAAFFPRRPPLLWAVPPKKFWKWGWISLVIDRLSVIIFTLSSSRED